MGGPGRGRENSRRGVSPPGKLSRGPAGPKAIVDIGRCSTSCCCCTPACPGRDAVPRRLHRRGHRRASRGRGGRGRACGLDRVSPLCRTSLKESARRRPSRQQGLLRSPCRPRWVWRRPKRIVVGCRQSPPAAGAAIDGGDMQKHERRISPKEQKGRQSSYVARVCENRNNQRG